MIISKKIEIELICFISNLLQIIQLFLWYQLNEVIYVYILIILWCSTRLFSAIYLIFNSKYDSLYTSLKQILKTLLTSEFLQLSHQVWSKTSNISAQTAFLIQIFMYSLPTTIINNHIITLNFRDNDNILLQISQLISVINIGILTISNLNYIQTQNQDIQISFRYFLTLFCRNLILWCLIGQFISLSYILLITWITLHYFVGILIASKLECGYRIKGFFKHIFQIEIYQLNTASSKYNILNLNQDSSQKNQSSIKKSSQTTYITMVYANLMVLLLLKLSLQPYINYFDYIIYLSYLIIIPSIARSLKLLHEKLYSVNNFSIIMEWSSEGFKDLQKIQNLCNNLVNEGKIYIKLEQFRKEINTQLISSSNDQISIDLNDQKFQNLIMYQFLRDIKELKNMINNNIKSINSKRIIIHFFDESKLIQIIIDFNQNLIPNQHIILKPGFDFGFATKILDIFQYIINNKYPIHTDVKEMDLLKIILKTVKFEKDGLIKNKDHENIISKIISSNYQSLAYYKNVAQLIPINPSLVLHDLFDYEKQQ